MRAYFRSGSVRVLVLYLVLFCFLRTSFSAEINLKTLTPLEEKIGQAKILYYDFHFNESERLLNETIASLQGLPPAPAVSHDLSEAYLHLALAQDAQDKTREMQASLYQCVSYEPSRNLDPATYSPKIVTQFKKAKQKFLLSQASETSNKLNVSAAEGKQNLNPLHPPDQKAKKPFYKTWPFFVILGVVVAGGAAGAAIALGGGGGGGGGGPATVGGTPQ